MLDVDVPQAGFTSRFSSSRITDTAYGRLGATRSQFTNIHGLGQHTGLYFKPDESGWGLNLVEQGNTLFGTLFVYDTSGRPKWYSASGLVYNGDTAWTRPLSEST